MEDNFTHKNQFQQIQKYVNIKLCMNLKQISLYKDILLYLSLYPHMFVLGDGKSSDTWNF